MQTKVYLAVVFLSMLVIESKQSIGDVHFFPNHFVIGIFAKPARTSRCPLDKPQVNCFVDPCVASSSYRRIF